MEINYLAILVCGIFSMILGSLWYGPLFGRKWVEIIGATDMDMEARKEMQKKAMPLYFISFVLVLVQLYVLSYFINRIDISAIETALLAFVGFVIPTVAAGSMWNNDSRRISQARFLIQAGYYLILFLVFGFILGMWS